MYELNVDRLVEGDVCEIAKKSHNDARLMLLAFGILTFVFTAAVIVASVWTFFLFDDGETAKGWLALIAAVATGAGAILLGKQTTDARKQEQTMFRRVQKAC